jgi:hypothetical protein
VVLKVLGGSVVFKGEGGVTLLATARSKRMVGDGSTFNEKILDEINGVDSAENTKDDRVYGCTRLKIFNFYHVLV